MPDRMNMTYSWAAWFDWVSIHPILENIAAGRTKRSVMNALRPVGRYCAHLNEIRSRIMVAIADVRQTALPGLNPFECS